MNDSDVIDAFVAYLRENGYPEIRVDRRPDEENRESADIDAIAGRFAIEHTSIDTLPNQRRDSDWFMRAVGSLEQEIEVPLPFHLHITLNYDAVQTGLDWAKVREALKAWICETAPSLSEGQSEIENAPGIPFKLRVIKSKERPSGIFFARKDPGGDDTLSERVKSTLSRKAKKLANYQSPSITTILLVETDDIALMNEWKILDAIQTAFPSGKPSGVDKVWYVDTSIKNSLEFRDFTSVIGGVEHSEDLQNVIEKLRRWAETKDQILELWLYGSRAKGTAQKDSDLDIAYQISPLRSEEAKIEFWKDVLPGWKKEIQELTPWPIHLEAKIVVYESVHEAGKKIYQAA
jgi:predicted nucleotidyltransferase